MSYNPEQSNPTPSNSIHTGGGAHVGGEVRTEGGDFVGRDQIRVGAGGRLILIQDGQPVELPSRAELLGHVAALRAAHSRWADPPADPSAEPEPPLYEQSDDLGSGPDAYIDTQALPMRVAAFRPLPGGDEPPAQDLVTALAGATRTLILGEPGSGKSTALERLAWVTATQAVAEGEPEAGDGNERPLPLPILARLADYQGEADLIPLLRRALNRHRVLQLTDASVRLLLWARDVRPVLLLDGLNEFEQSYRDRGPGAIGRHLDDYPTHLLHVTCRTADFDPENQTIPDAQLWTVQPLVDAVRYWDDAEGHSDVRAYLRRHLGNAAGKRLYERLLGDERLHQLAQIPLFLWMFKETAGDGAGELPANRGALLRRFVRAPRLLGRVPKELRTRAERSLEAVGWALQGAGTLDLNEDALYTQLETVRGRRSYELDTMRRHLQESGLLLELGDERYRPLHQLVQEYGAAAHLVRQLDCAAQLPQLAQSEWWRESCILALWLRDDLHTPDYLQRLMRDPAVDLRVRITAAHILAQVGDPRFPVQTTRITVTTPEGDEIEQTVRYIEPTMVRIPGGQAVLGGEDPDGMDNELPQCTVPVDAFDLAVYPVTNAEYRCFLEAGGYDDETLWTPAGQAWLRGEGRLDAETEELYRNVHRSLRNDVEGFLAQLKSSMALSDQDADAYRTVATWDEDRFVQWYAGDILSEQRREPRFWHDSRFNGPTQPVVGVNWYEATAYAAWLARLTGEFYCLPSEAQWEWAARRHTPSGADRRYPWGADWDAARANSRGSRLNAPSPAGVYTHGTTPDGLHELAGNVYEWTRSLYRPYPYDPADGREDVDTDGLRVYRGGSWYVGAEQARCAFRNRDHPWNWYGREGYRLARLLSR